MSVIPQIAMGVFDANSGLRYKTTIQITNSGLSPVSASAEFFNADGTPLAAPLETSIGSLSDFVLPANGTAIITAGDFAGGVVGWGRVRASSHVSITTVFDITDAATSEVRSRLWFPPSATRLRRFVVPRSRNVKTGADAGFAIVNTGSSSATFTSTLIDSNGLVLASRTTTLAPHEQLSMLAGAHFGLAGESSQPSQSVIVFDSDSAQLAAVGIAFDGTRFLNVPVDPIP